MRTALLDVKSLHAPETEISEQSKTSWRNEMQPQGNNVNHWQRFYDNFQLCPSFGTLTMCGAATQRGLTQSLFTGLQGQSCSRTLKPSRCCCQDSLSPALVFEEQLKDAMLSSWFQLMITHNVNVKNNKGWNPVLLLQQSRDWIQRSLWCI